MTRQLFEEITKWQDETFPHSTEQSRIAHLKKEVLELEKAVVQHQRRPNAVTIDDKKDEYTDCFFLLFGAAKKAGMSYEDICNAILRKFRVNEKRKWGKPDKNGVVEHIRKQ